MSSRKKDVDTFTAFATELVKHCNSNGLFNKKVDASGYKKNQFLKMPLDRRKNLVSEILARV